MVIQTSNPIFSFELVAVRFETFNKQMKGYQKIGTRDPSWTLEKLENGDPSETLEMSENRDPIGI